MTQNGASLFLALTVSPLTGLCVYMPQDYKDVAPYGAGNNATAFQTVSGSPVRGGIFVEDHRKRIPSPVGATPPDSYVTET
jgi:hypothetical protein